MKKFSIYRKSKKWLKIKIREDLSEAKINEIINNLNSTNFFEDINVEFRNNILTLNLREYPVINQIIINQIIIYYLREK